MRLVVAKSGSAAKCEVAKPRRQHAVLNKEGTCLPFALGVFVVTLLKMLTRTRKRVMSRAIRPGITSGGTTKLIQETTTNSPEGRKKNEQIKYVMDITS